MRECYFKNKLMGIRIKEVQEVELLGKFLFDESLPITLNLNEGDIFDEVLHYEVITDSDSFFEIEIFKNSGKIKTILLTNCNEKDIINVDSIFIEPNKVVKGEPILNTSYFNTEENDYFGRFLREKGFSILKSNDGISIKLKKEEPLKYIFFNKNCYFGVSNINQILVFTMLSIDADDMECFNSSIVV